MTYIVSKGKLKGYRVVYYLDDGSTADVKLADIKKCTHLTLKEIKALSTLIREGGVKSNSSSVTEVPATKTSSSSKTAAMSTKPTAKSKGSVARSSKPAAKSGGLGASLDAMISQATTESSTSLASTQQKVSDPISLNGAMTCPCAVDSSSLCMQILCRTCLDKLPTGKRKRGDTDRLPVQMASKANESSKFKCDENTHKYRSTYEAVDAKYVTSPWAKDQPNLPDKCAHCGAVFF